MSVASPCVVPSVRTVNPFTLTTRAWHRLVSIAELKAEDWGEGWLRLQQLFAGDRHLTEDLAIKALRKISEASAAVKELTLNVA